MLQKTTPKNQLFHLSTSVIFIDACALLGRLRLRHSLSIFPTDSTAQWVCPFDCSGCTNTQPCLVRIGTLNVMPQAKGAPLYTYRTFTTTVMCPVHYIANLCQVPYLSACLLLVVFAFIALFYF